ncbi:hypothetical protein FGO68_gene6461 [Halteria grandinella]|uniref:Uncharacterized protein n=1 Tax=Halteria grandinella TaxID=5974 RepID=A0A8J8SVM9_HALGN|nr:hypothetical protein FGO68_gene6461 [Halteria grandinella]
MNSDIAQILWKPKQTPSENKPVHQSPELINLTDSIAFTENTQSELKLKYAKGEQLIKQPKRQNRLQMSITSQTAAQKAQDDHVNVVELSLPLQINNSHAGSPASPTFLQNHSFGARVIRDAHRLQVPQSVFESNKPLVPGQTNYYIKNVGALKHAGDFIKHSVNNEGEQFEDIRRRDKTFSSNKKETKI